MEKQRLAHVSIGRGDADTAHDATILTGRHRYFPLLVLAAVFNKLTLSVLKGYVFALMWLQSWPMYAILNSAMTFYAKRTVHRWCSQKFHRYS